MQTEQHQPLLTINVDEVEKLVEKYKGDAYRKIVEQLERHILSAALIRNYGNQTKTAEQLGLNRGTLRKKMAAHGITDSE